MSKASQRVRNFKIELEVVIDVMVWRENWFPKLITACQAIRFLVDLLDGNWARKDLQKKRTFWDL